MKIIKGRVDYPNGDPLARFSPPGLRPVWVVVESDAAGDETMTGFGTEFEARAFRCALRARFTERVEQLRRGALVRVEKGKYTTPTIFLEP
jgi:hypothetical protein